MVLCLGRTVRWAIRSTQVLLNIQFKVLPLLGTTRERRPWFKVKAVPSEGGKASVSSQLMGISLPPQGAASADPPRPEWQVRGIDEGWVRKEAGGAGSYTSSHPSPSSTCSSPTGAPWDLAGWRRLGGDTQRKHIWVIWTLMKKVKRGLSDTCSGTLMLKADISWSSPSVHDPRLVYILISGLSLTHAPSEPLWTHHDRQLWEAAHVFLCLRGVTVVLEWPPPHQNPVVTNPHPPIIFLRLPHDCSSSHVAFRIFPWHQSSVDSKQVSSWGDQTKRHSVGKRSCAP